MEIQPDHKKSDDNSTMNDSFQSASSEPVLKTRVVQQRWLNESGFLNRVLKGKSSKHQVYASLASGHMALAAVKSFFRLLQRKLMAFQLLWPMRQANLNSGSAPLGNLHASIAIGQSLAIWICTSDSKRYNWSAKLEWQGKALNSQLKMFNGGIFLPGINHYTIDPAGQQEVVDAFDELMWPKPEMDALGNLTGQISYMVSTSPAIAFMMRRVLGAASNQFQTNWLYAAIAISSLSIDRFLKPETYDKDSWFFCIFEPTLKNLRVAAKDFKLEISDFPIEHGEADSQIMTREIYRYNLDKLVAQVVHSAKTITSQSNDPVVVQTQIGTPLLSNGAKALNRPYLSVCDVSLAILNKGLSRAPRDKNYICVGPRYDLTFVGISHLTHDGYIHNDERRAYVLNEHHRLQSLWRPKKWMPTHVIAIKQVQVRESWFLKLRCHVPFAPLQLDLNLVPLKKQFGFTLEGGNTPPAILDCHIASDGVTIMLKLEKKWTGVKRILGVATKAIKGRQGWLTSDGSPNGEWQHVGVATNFHDSAPWSSVTTGQALPNWLSSQYIALPEG